MSTTPTDVRDAILTLADEVKLLRERQQRHHERGMAAADADTERKIAASHDDLEAYATRMVAAMEAQNSARAEMQKEIDELREALGRVFTGRPS